MSVIINLISSGKPHDLDEYTLIRHLIKYIPTGRVNKVTTRALEANTKFVIDKFVGEDN